MPKLTDIRPVAVSLYLLPATLRMPLKFGSETTTSVVCARVRVRVEDRNGRQADGWGETPLAVNWAWVSQLSYSERLSRAQAFCRRLAEAWIEPGPAGHPLEIGHDFLEERLPALLAEEARAAAPSEPIPQLAGLIFASAFDLATHDALGTLLGHPTYSLYGPELLNRDLADYLTPAGDANVNFRGKTPADFLIAEPPRKLVAWHLVGGLDPLTPDDESGQEPRDGHPVNLLDWIARDGLTCLKIKLRGTDAAWDRERLARVGRIALERNVPWLTADFNCTVTDPAYVLAALDALEADEPQVYERLLYVEQPFPSDLDAWPIDTRAISARTPLFLDESAHDWRFVRRGRELGWTGVALKTCKTQTGALLSLCWAKAHKMSLMVQDLTNLMLAQISHVQLAAHAGTIMGVETNGMQFYPDASLPEAAVHPGLYQRRGGQLDLSTLGPTGFGYRLNEIQRQLPPAECSCA
jgi:L-alanine-DL-glutamate epimerase-like enolase superfamily enzyme